MPEDSESTESHQEEEPSLLDIPLRQSTRVHGYAECLQVDPKNKSCEMAAEEPMDPRLYSEATASPQWVQWINAIEGELALLHNMGTWIFVLRAWDMKIVKSK